MFREISSSEIDDKSLLMKTLLELVKCYFKKVITLKLGKYEKAWDQTYVFFTTVFSHTSS